LKSITARQLSFRTLSVLNHSSGYPRDNLSESESFYYSG
jgi:hypothetical protein